MRRHPACSDGAKVDVMRKCFPAILTIAAAVAASIASIHLARAEPASSNNSAGVPTNGWSGERAMGDIAALLRFTPRSLDSQGHQQAIDFIKAQLATTQFKAITTQSWTYRGNDGTQHALTNIIARLDPSNPRRIIVATHYDSIVRAYRDAKNPNAPMPGANNSASGVALLLETARAIGSLPPPPVGIDMVFFDGEEGPKSLGAGDPDWFALGSPYFTTHLDDLYHGRKPEKSVVFDMVCYGKLQLTPEATSLLSAPNEVQKFWNIGATIAPSVFLRTARPRTIDDDQSALAAADIPSILVIDFEYEPWFNTAEDTIDKCSAGSLEAVGRTLLRYLYAP
jgi:glutaminyl-peptide cyclotransferase